MRNYTKVKIKALPWQKVIQVIKDQGYKGISILDLADKMDVSRAPTDPRLLKAIEQLKTQGRIHVSMGQTKSGVPSNIVRCMELYDAAKKKER